ncbi:alpha-2,3-sialyltransferase, partial [Campylobacter coli]|nr:alpha-2,3-sialyltransferase [Campylobacter coli]EHT9171316.1 alpha-2,3-sialyltransferase [Campylobacter coli]ELH7393503.1 alpha-2,3-sialyltransferase [Campylobacter coli]
KTIKEKDLVINSGINQINQLQNNMQEKITQLNQLQFRLSFQSQHGTAKQRIQNQLSYKLGQTMIINSKNIFGILFMPVYIISTLLSHKQEQKIYQEKIKKDPSLKLPSLESYPDYK